MPGRPPINLNQKVRDLLTHTVPLPSGVDAPIRNFEERINAGHNFALLPAIFDHLRLHRLAVEIIGLPRAAGLTIAAANGYLPICIKQVFF